MSEPTIDRIVVQRMVHRLVVERLIERVYDQPLIGNVERGQYVECMIELALSELRPPWKLTDTWSGWDLEQHETGARIEVKQSAALQTWKTPGRSVPSFKIPSRTGYYADGGGGWVATKNMRHADLYVMAWHGETDSQLADHRQPAQWQFYVVPEHLLSPGQQRIGLNPVASIRPPCTYEDLAGRVAAEFALLPGLKAQLTFD